VIEELDQLYEAGYRHVFLTDDNLTANRKRARELLTAIAGWNGSNRERTEFTSQISIDAAADDEMPRFCAEAGITTVFVGVETPNLDSLKGVGKHQNVKGDVRRQIERFVEQGIVVLGGMVVGFDSDGPEIFRRQYAFAMSTPVPVFTSVTLFAHPTTPLHERFRKEGRIAPGYGERPFTPWDTNVIPQGMTREELFNGLRWLVNKLYEPRAFARRVARLVEMLSRRDASRASRESPGSLRPVEWECLRVLGKLPFLGFAEARLAARLAGLILARPRLARIVVQQALIYMQFRHVFRRGEYWEPALARLAGPAAHADVGHTVEPPISKGPVLTCLDA
jgi:radical SAM superfamily enzyme YgiQ (UPF0313 family)